MARTYNTVIAGRDRQHIKQKDVLEPGTVIYRLSFHQEDVWITSAASALAMWEKYEDEATLWVKVDGKERRVR